MEIEEATESEERGEGRGRGRRGDEAERRAHSVRSRDSDLEAGRRSQALMRASDDGGSFFSLGRRDDGRSNFSSMVDEPPLTVCL